MVLSFYCFKLWLCTMYSLWLYNTYLVILASDEMEDDPDFLSRYLPVRDDAQCSARTRMARACLLFPQTCLLLHSFYVREKEHKRVLKDQTHQRASNSEKKKQSKQFPKGVKSLEQSSKASEKKYECWRITVQWWKTHQRLTMYGCVCWKLHQGKCRVSLSRKGPNMCSQLLAMLRSSTLGHMKALLLTSKET